MLYNRFDNLTIDFGGENDGAKIFALRPLGGAVFDENNFFFIKPLTSLLFQSKNMPMRISEKFSCELTFNSIYKHCNL
jgi:hypothetical protein